MLRLRSCIVLAALASGAPLAAQPAGAPDTVRVGSSHIRTDRLATRADTLELWLRDGGGKTPAGTLVLWTELPDDFGPEMVERRETLLAGGVVVEETTWIVDSRDLSPIAYQVWLDEREATSIGFIDEVVDGWRDDRGRRVMVRDTLPQPRFLAPSMDLLLAALPLSPGAAYVLPVWDEDEGSGWAAVRVAGLEALEGAVRAWRVEVDGGATRGTYWLDRESHALVRYQGEGYRLSRPSRRARPSVTTETDR